MLAGRDGGTQVGTFHGAICPVQGYAAAPLMGFFVGLVDSNLGTLLLITVVLL